MDDKSIARKIVTQGDVARMVGVDPATLSRVLAGGPCSLDTARKLQKKGFKIIPFLSGGGIARRKEFNRVLDAINAALKDRKAVDPSERLVTKEEFDALMKPSNEAKS